MRWLVDFTSYGWEAFNASGLIRKKTKCQPLELDVYSATIIGFPETVDKAENGTVQIPLIWNWSAINFGPV